MLKSHCAFKLIKNYRLIAITKHTSKYQEVCQIKMHKENESPNKKFGCTFQARKSFQSNIIVAEKKSYFANVSQKEHATDLLETNRPTPAILGWRTMKI